MTTPNPVAVAAEEARQKAAADKLKEALRDFYGEEKTLIVENTTQGGVSIGFGKIGTEAGHLGYLIPRSRLPIVLTEFFPAEYWRDSPDFRQELSKGRIRFVTKQAYDLAVEAETAHQARLAALAGTDKPVQVAYDAQMQRAQANVLNAQSAQLEASTGGAQQVADYEKRLDLPPPPAVLKDGRSARAEALVEQTRRGAITSLDSIKQLDADAPLYTDEDLNYIAGNAEYPGLKSFAQSLLHTRKAGS